MGAYAVALGADSTAGTDAMSIEMVSDGLADPILTIGSFGRGWWQRVVDDEPGEQPLFADGFESGNTSAWTGG